MRLHSMLLAGGAMLLAAAAGFAPSPAEAGDGWYAGIGAGWDQIANPKILVPGLNGKIGAKQAPVVMGTAGYKFQDMPIRLEFEGSWVDHDVADYVQAGGGVRGTGTAGERALMLNALYDIHIMPAVRLSLGAGAGAGDDRISFDQTGGGLALRTGLRHGFMWQAIGGLAYTPTRDLDLFIEYHYRELRNGSNHPPVPYAQKDLRENIVMAGLRWYPFTEPEAAPAPMPAPRPYEAPPPAPPSPPPVLNFVLFFDFDKSSLSAEARSVITQAVRSATQNNAVHIRVIGHTDTTGSDRYNQALSERRADSVKQEMVREGMKTGEISTIGKSFHDPLIATGPGVREPQNRRAVIDMGL